MTEGVGKLSSEIARPTIADPQLIALARESKEEALEVMYNAYKTRIYTFLLRMCGDPETSDDLTQDVFTKAYQAFATLTAPCRSRTTFGASCRRSRRSRPPPCSCTPWRAIRTARSPTSRVRACL